MPNRGCKAPRNGLLADPGAGSSTIAPIGFCTSRSSRRQSRPAIGQSGLELLSDRAGDADATKQAKVAAMAMPIGAGSGATMPEPFRGAPQIAPVREPDRDVRDGDERGCLHEQPAMSTDGITSGGSSAIGARLVPTKKPSRPSTIQSPVMSMADAGSSGVTRARRPPPMVAAGGGEPSPTSSSSGPSTRSPRARTAAPARSSSTAGLPKRR